MPLLLIAWIAAICGDNVGFVIGHFGGGYVRRLLLRFGRYVGLTPARLEAAEARFRRIGPPVVVIARFIEVLRQLNGILAGIAGMHWLRFLLLNALGAALWVGFWGTLAWQLGERVHQLAALFKRFELPALGVLVLLLAAYVSWHLLRRRRQKVVDREGGGSSDSDHR